MSSTTSQNEETPQLDFLSSSASSSYSPLSSASFDPLPPSMRYLQATGLPEPASWCQAEQLPSPPLEGSTTFEQPRLPEASYFDHSALDGTTNVGDEYFGSHSLQLSSFDPSTSSYPPLSAPASFSSSNSSSSFTTPPLESTPSFLPYDGSSASPSSSMTRPSYVQTFRLPGPSTPPSASSSTTSRKRALHPSPSLSAALSVLGQTPPWTQRERQPLSKSEEAPPTSLFTSLEAAAETLRTSPRLPAPPSLDLNATFNPKRPKPFRSSTEPYASLPYSPISVSEANSPATSISTKSPSRSKGKKRPEGHVPRAPNAWILYRSARVKELTESGKAPKLQSDISKLIGSMWREESAEVKEIYARKASVEAKLHAERNPGYTYKPTPSGIPRRKPSSKKEKGLGRERSRTTSALQAHLSGFTFDSSSTSPSDIPSVLLPSPFPTDSSTINDYAVEGSYSYEDSPFSPSTIASTPSSSASEAWTVFQASGLPSFDYGLPQPQAAYNEEPCSAPARVSTFPFSFSQPPPIFEPFHPDESYSQSSFDVGCSSSSMSSSSSVYPSVLAPPFPSSTSFEQTTNYEDFLASLPTDESGQISVPVSNYGDSEYSEDPSTLYPIDQNLHSQQYSIYP